MNANDENTDLAQMLAAIVESSHDAIIGKNLNGIITSWNSGAAHLFGYAAEEIIGKPVTMLIPPDRHSEEDHILGCIRRGERVVSYETVRQRKDGSLVEISLTVSPIKNAEGRVVGASKIARDITELRRVQKQQALLLGEMKHRIKNLLVVMDALGRSAIPKNETAVEAFFGEYMGRMRALLSAGEIVVSSSSRQADLREVAEITLHPFTDANNTLRISIEGPALLLSENTAGGLALAFHELATNALKYGALKTPDGRIEISWSVARAAPNEQMANIVWKEHLRHVVSEPTGRGFGTRLIKAAVTSEQKGKTSLQFEPDGLKCVFEFAISG
jgi:two-component system, chemotaxis family, CheB/CheR fusion protein